VKRIAILGSTGSIGQSALAVVDAHPDRLQVVGLAAGENHELFGAQIARYRPRVAAMATGGALDRLKQSGADAGVTIEGAGRDGLAAVASHPDGRSRVVRVERHRRARGGARRDRSGKTIALANKEVLVMAGAIVTEAAARNNVAILPVDSEHNAIHQCLDGRPRSHMRRLVLTASGGPFAAEPRASSPTSQLMRPSGTRRGGWGEKSRSTRRP
jgi:1-deoxy-D-xylulose-5-phosphate reductoisomerase